MEKNSCKNGVAALATIMQNLTFKVSMTQMNIQQLE